MNYFLEVYGTLPRAGPGSNALTRKAFEMMPDLGQSSRVLDVGCGPGMQTMALLDLGAGEVVALDLLPEMIERVGASARQAGVADRLETVVSDMQDMDFPPASFDVIWSEGAIYNMGFEAGLRQFRKFLRPGGYVAVSEAVWLKPNPPGKALEFWRDYPEIDTVASKLTTAVQTGYDTVGHFVFPAAAWTDQYYDPMEEKIARLAKDWQGIAEAEAVLSEARKEISVFHECSEYFSYAFFVLQANA